MVVSGYPCLSDSVMFGLFVGCCLVFRLSILMFAEDPKCSHLLGVYFLLLLVVLALADGALFSIYLVNEFYLLSMELIVALLLLSAFLYSKDL